MHGLTSGTSAPLANMGKEQYLLRMSGWFSERVDFLGLQTNTGARLFTGFGTQNRFNVSKPILGFFGGTKDGVLSTLGVYILDSYRLVPGSKR